jgi:CRP-like cAMP-binding protein
MAAHRDEGTQAEMSMVGRDGLVGISLVTGVDTAFTKAYVQSAGEALQMETTVFQRELDAHPVFFRRLLRYTEAMHAQTMQTATCNGRHDLEQRLARWILMAHDRSDSDELPLTQEYLA